MFVKIKINSKKLYYSNTFLKYQKNTKKLVIKEIIGKSEIPSKTVNSSDIYIVSAKHFNKYFVDIGPTLAKNIPPSKNSFTSYLSQTQYFLRNQTFTSAELETRFFSIRKNKATGSDQAESAVCATRKGTFLDGYFCHRGPLG